MAVVLETTLGDITIDLYLEQRPKACLNFLKLCRIKYYNFNLFHTVNHGFIAQTGDPTGSRDGGESVWGVMEGAEKRYFEAENTPRIKHTRTGLVSFVGDKDSMIGSQFFITLADDLTYLDAQHCVFGEVAEGFDILRLLNEAICDTDHRPYQDIRITHTVVLEDPFPDPDKLQIPDGSPEPTAERLQGGRIAPDEDIDETAGKSAQEVLEVIAEKEAKARATILEMIGDIPDAEMAPPENVLFVCKLNPVTNDDDLEIIFSRFGKIKSCEVIRDKKTGDSLQYAFVEFMEQKSCEDAYFKMDNVLIDDRRIHVDFSQSVAKIKWHGKGRGVTHFNDRGERENGDPKNDIGKGHYRFIKRDIKLEEKKEKSKSRSRSRSRSSRSRSRSKSRSRSRTRSRSKSRSRSGSRSKTRQNGNRYRRNYESKRYEEYKDRFNDRPYYNNYRQMNYNNYNHRGFNNRRFHRRQQYSRDRRNDYVDYRRFDNYQRRRDFDRPRKSRSRSRDNTRSRNRDEVMRYKKETEDKPTKKVEKKKYSSEESSAEEVVTKKSKKSKKKKSKKKKHSDQSGSDSEEHKKSKKKRKKSKKRRSSSSSGSDSDSDEPSPKKKSKKH